MNKEDILARKRAENIDEMEQMVTDKSNNWGIITIMIVCLFFAGTKVINGEPFFEFPAILFASLMGSSLYSYIRLKNRKYITTMIAWGVAFICMTILYFLNWR